MELGSYFLFLQEQIKDIIIIWYLAGCLWQRWGSLPPPPPMGGFGGSGLVRARIAALEAATGSVASRTYPCPSRTSERGGEGYCVKEGGGEEGERERGSVQGRCDYTTALDIEVDP